MTERTNSLQEGTGIELPASLFQRLGDQLTGSSVGIFFGLYETATLFPTGGTSSDSRTTKIYSQVLAATVGHNLAIQNLESPVTISFKQQKLEGIVSSTLFLIDESNNNIIIVSHNSLVHRSFFEKMCLVEF